ncbi:MAG: hypothetical protein M3Y86_06950 [Verrucomicrobiota bacterium]|nr:hypothetical protein [Verrucomicrobiota bacterium]
MNTTAPSSTNVLFPGGVREFKTRTAKWFPYVFGGCFGTIGLIAAIIGFAGLVMHAGSSMALPLLIGLLFVAIGIGIPVGTYYFGKRYSISCRPDGFLVRTENKRKGTEQHEYAWSAVTATRYDEMRSTDRESRNETYVSFTAETTEGRAFKVGREIGDLAGLIRLFNAMTPQLPYTWEPQTGFSVSVGVFSAGRSAYVQHPRATATAPSSAAPPPLPTAPPPLPHEPPPPLPT